MKIVLQLLGAALAYSRIISAQHVDGNVGANNQSTPQVVEGDHVVHFVTVGKATNNFEVRTCYHLSQNNAERLRSQTVFVRVRATLLCSNSIRPTTPSSEQHTAIHAYHMIM